MFLTCFFKMCIRDRLTYRDFENETANENTRNTINKLWEVDYIPIVNENDTVSIEEIVLGDNDKLSALVAAVSYTHLDVYKRQVGNTKRVSG